VPAIFYQSSVEGVVGTNTIPVAFVKPTASGAMSPLFGSTVPTKFVTPESLGDWV